MTKILDEGAIAEIEAQINSGSLLLPLRVEHWHMSLTSGGGWYIKNASDRIVMTVAFVPVEIETGKPALDGNAPARHTTALLNSIPALCATVKHLRELAYLPKVLPNDEEITFQETSARLLRERLALQSQLEQLRAIAEGALRFRVEMNGACNHDEHMTKLCTQCEIRAALEKL